MEPIYSVHEDDTQSQDENSDMQPIRNPVLNHASENHKFVDQQEIFKIGNVKMKSRRKGAETYRIKNKPTISIFANHQRTASSESTFRCADENKTVYANRFKRKGSKYTKTKIDHTHNFVQKGAKLKIEGGNSNTAINKSTDWRNMRKDSKKNINCMNFN